MAQHVPVLCGPVVAAFDRQLAVAPVVDGTFGYGGHSGALLARFPGLRVIGIDRDPRAVDAAAALAAGHAGRAVVRHGRFGDWPGVLQRMGVERAAGLLLDLGVSSPQLDVAERGFSFAREGPLDMRMDDSTGPTALEFVRACDETELARVLWEYGEERLSRRIARGIKQALAEDRLSTTRQLADICRRAYPPGPQRIDPATRTFQALRIVLNDELGELERALAGCETHLASPGVVAVISFHSLEDRIVKLRFRDWQARGLGRILKPELVTADDNERQLNPRSRSAKLRVFLWGDQGPHNDPKDKYRSKKHRK